MERFIEKISTRLQKLSSVQKAYLFGLGVGLFVGRMAYLVPKKGFSTEKEYFLYGALGAILILGAFMICAVANNKEKKEEIEQSE